MAEAVAAVRTLEPGAELGPYNIVSFLASGGMGEIYVARDTRLRRDVAVKVLPSTCGSDADRLRRFEQEAQAASRLNHPNILSIYDIGRDGELPFIVMELLEGETLRKILRDGALPLPRALDYAAQILRGLTAAHEKGIVHRDLKPANLFITRAGHLKVLDFGLAKLTHPEWERTSDQEDTISMVTVPGVILGSAGYMSPEQVEGATADARSDIFSFGAILYEMITGRRAFRGESNGEVMVEILTAAPDRVPLLESDAPHQLISVVTRCLEKKPEQRFQNARDLLFAIEEIAAAEASAVSRTSMRIRQMTARVAARPRAISLGAAITVLGVVIVLAVRGIAQSPSDQKQFPWASATTTRLTSEGDIESMSISPDGEYYAYVAPRHGQSTLRLRHISSGSDLELFAAASPASIDQAVFARDGNSIYFAESEGADGSLQTIPLLGGRPRLIHRGRVGPVSLSLRGDRLAFSTFTLPERRSELWIAAADGTGIRRISETSGGRRFVGGAWGADGSTFQAIVSRFGGRELLSIDTASGAVRPVALCRQVGPVTSLQTLSDGSGMIATQTPPSGGQLWFVSFDGSCTQLTHDPSTWYGAGGTTGDPAVLGVTGYQGVYNVWRVPLDGTEGPAERLTTAINMTEGMGGLASLPDGGVVYTFGHFLAADLWVLEPDGDRRRLTSNAGSESHPDVSPDGTQVVYVETTSEGDTRVQRLWRVPVAGGEPQQLTGGTDATHPQYSSDGRWIYFGSAGTLVRIPAGGGTAENAMPSGIRCNAPALSPGADLVACPDDNATAVEVRRVDTGEIVRRLPSHPESPGRWSPDGKGLVYLEGVKPTNLWFQPIDGGEPRPLTHLSSEQIFEFDFAPDGRSVVCSRGSSVTDAFLMRLQKPSSQR